jgi:hypothetical protein
MMSIKLPDEFGITVESTVDTSLNHIQKMLAANKEDEISLDFSDTQLLYPSSLVILTIIGNYLMAIKNCKIKQNRPKDPKANNFLTESGFCEIVGIPQKVDKSVRPHNGTRIYRLKQFEYSVEDFEIEKLIDVINKELALSGHIRTNIHETLAELILNVYQHSNSSAGCYVMGQGYADTHQIRFCIGDAGIGIKNHLGNRYKELLSKNSAFAIEMALIEGITGTMYNENSGMGLAYLKRFVNLVGGSFAILSGDGLYIEKTDSRGSKSIKKELEFEVPGTFVDVTIKSEPGLKVFSKSESIPPEYRLIK